MGAPLFALRYCHFVLKELSQHGLSTSGKDVETRSSTVLDTFFHFCLARSAALASPFTHILKMEMDSTGQKGRVRPMPYVMENAAL